MASHRINLRGPWDYVWTSASSASSATESTSGTFTMPQEWCTVFGRYAGTAVFRRKFHRPTNLEPRERVTILLTEVCGQGHARLNKTPLGNFASTGDPVEFDITNCLEPFNELSIEIGFDPAALPESPGGLFGVVAIQISSD